jgi:hypothetical protein
VLARNGVQDNIYGGPGRDVAVIDSGPLDSVSGVEECRYAEKGPKVACPLAPRPRRAQQPIIFPGLEAILECRLEPGTNKRQIWIPYEPVIRAVDSTPRVDWQKVAYAALLYQWDGTTWRFVTQNTWLWDHTYDQSVPAKDFPQNFWRRFDTGQRWFVWFYPQSAGQFRVAIKYHWYATSTAPEHEDLLWAGRHYGDYDNGTHESCVFPT